jgi:hypothetical protein
VAQPATKMVKGKAGMSELFLGAHPFLTLLVLVVATVGTIISISILLTTRRVLRLSERRIRFLTEEQQRLEMRRNEYAILEKALEQEREARLAAQHEVGLLEEQLEAAKRPKRTTNRATGH